MSKRKLTPVVGQNDPLAQELANVQGALGCCDTALELVGSQTPAVKDLDRYRNAHQWLSGVKQQLIGSYVSLQQQIQKRNQEAALAAKEAKDAAPAPQGN